MRETYQPSINVVTGAHGGCGRSMEHPGWICRGEHRCFLALHSSEASFMPLFSCVPEASPGLGQMLTGPEQKRRLLRAHLSLLVLH